MVYRTALLAALLSLSLLSGCANQPDEAAGALLGTWTEPVPGQPGSVQGFELEADGSARSVNMATLQYERWRLQDGALVLEGKSIGNGQTIPFTETLRIERLTDKTLVTDRAAYQRAP